MRRLLGVALALALVAGALVGAEWAAHRLVGDRIAAGVQAGLGLASPRVTVSGSPLLWDLVNRRIPAVHVESDSMPMQVSERNVAFTDVVLDATGVTLDGNQAGVARLEGRALLDYGQVSGIAGVPVRSAGQGRFGVTYDVEVWGQQVSATLTGSPEVDIGAQTISLTRTTIQVAGIDIPDDVVRPILLRLVKPIPVNLERGLILQSVEAVEEGFRMRLSGESLTFPLA
jgi:hypothetical protein